MKIKTAELTGAALDYAAAKCEGRTIKLDPMGFKSGSQAGVWIWEETPSGEGGIILPKSVYMLIGKYYSPSTNWAQGGPIIERESLELGRYADLWQGEAHLEDGSILERGPTPLIAAMRCYVASKLGDEVEIPDELVTKEK